MKIWKVVLAFAVFLFLISYYLIYEKKEKRVEEERLFDLNWESVESLEVESKGGNIKLKKQGDSWRIIKPIDVEADGEVVADLLTSVKLMTVKRVIEEKGENKSYYGLEDPEGRIRFITEDNKTSELLIGKRSPVGYSVYVMRGDQQRIVLVEAGIEQFIRKKVLDWREKRLLLLKEKDIETIRIKSPNGRVMLERKGDDWEILYPVKEKADRDEVFSYIYSVGGIRAVEYPNISIIASGLNKPEVEVEIGLKGGNKRHLIMSKRGKKVFAAVKEKGEVVGVEEKSWREVAKKALDFRIRRIFDVEPEKITSIEIQKGSEKIQVRKDGNIWKLTSPGSADADDGKISSFIFRLKGWKAEDIVDNPGSLERYGINNKSLTANFYVEGSSEPVVLSIGKISGKDKLYLWTNRRDKKVYIVNRRLEDIFPKSANEWIKGEKN